MKIRQTIQIRHIQRQTHKRVPYLETQRMKKTNHKENIMTHKTNEKHENKHNTKHNENDKTTTNNHGTRM